LIHPSINKSICTYFNSHVRRGHISFTDRFTSVTKTLSEGKFASLCCSSPLLVPWPGSFGFEEVSLDEADFGGTDCLDATATGGFFAAAAVLMGAAAAAVLMGAAREGPISVVDAAFLFCSAASDLHSSILSELSSMSWSSNAA
jgi:hypothetical protein